MPQSKEAISGSQDETETLPKTAGALTAPFKQFPLPDGGNLRLCVSLKAMKGRSDFACA
jgi:hypothetical protein